MLYENNNKVQFIIENENYYYDFENMSIAQISACESMFTLHLQMFTNLPKTPSDMEVILERQMLAKARALLLMKVKNEKNGNVIEYEAFTPATHSSNILNGLKGNDFVKLESCKDDFFMRTPLFQIESQRQQMRLMPMLKDLDLETIEKMRAIEEIQTSNSIQTVKNNKEKNTMKIKT